MVTRGCPREGAAHVSGTLEFYFAFAEEDVYALVDVAERWGRVPSLRLFFEGLNGVDAAPETWHHGLVARWWAEFNPPEADELAYYRNAIEHFGEPALDLACGVG